MKKKSVLLKNEINDEMIEDKIEEKKEIKDDNININKIIEKDKELFDNSEKKDEYYYKDFNVENIMKIITLKTDMYLVNDLFILSDGRIFITGKNFFFKFKSYIFDLRNDKFIDLDLNLEQIKLVYQMEDDIFIVINDSDIQLINIKGDTFEKLQTMKISFYKILKLSNKKILVIISEKFDKISIIK